MHVVIWQASWGAVAYGAFPDYSEAEEWLFPVVPFVIPRVLASVTLVTPAYEYRRAEGAGSTQTAAGKAVHSGLRSDRWAYGFLVALLKDGAVKAAVGVFGARRDAYSWWTAQRQALATAHGAVHGLVVPLLPVPITPDAFARLLAGPAAEEPSV